MDEDHRERDGLTVIVFWFQVKLASHLFSPLDGKVPEKIKGMLQKIRPGFFVETGRPEGIGLFLMAGVSGLTALQQLWRFLSAAAEVGGLLTEDETGKLLTDTV